MVERLERLEEGLAVFEKESSREIGQQLALSSI